MLNIATAERGKTILQATSGPALEDRLTVCLSSTGYWEGASSVSNSFNVDWLRRFDLPFRSTEGVTNPLNDNKPVKISRDGQELPLPLGLKLCRMFDEGADAAGVPRPSPAGKPPALPCSNRCP
jgi:hypothetical protein